MRTKAEILASESGLANGDDYETMRLAVVANQTASTNAVSVMWAAADEAAMLALSNAKKGHFAKRADIQSGYKWIYILNQLPVSNLANWSPFAIWYTEATGSGTLDFTALAQCGNYASTSENPFPTTGGTGDAGAILAGNTFINTGSYWVGRALLIAKTDSPGQNADNWEVMQPYIPFTPINVALRTTEVVPGSLTFPNNDAVIAYLATQLSALIGTLSEPSTTKYVAVNELVAALAAKADANTITALLNGFAFKTTPCRVATTENIVLSDLQEIDGILISEDDSVLVWKQTDKTQNGIYLAKDGAWLRREDADTALKLKAATVRVTEGTENGDQQFTQIHEDVIIGTDNIEFTKSGATAAFATLAGVPGDNAALAAALLLKANDNAVLKLTGDQTASGKKNFPEGFSGSYIKGTTITGNVTIDASYINKYHYVEAAAVITIPNGVLSEGNQIKFIRDTSGEVQFVAGGTAELRVAGTKRLRIAEQNEAVELIAKTSTVLHIFGALKI